MVCVDFKVEAKNEKPQMKPQGKGSLIQMDRLSHLSLRATRTKMGVSNIRNSVLAPIVGPILIIQCFLIKNIIKLAKYGMKYNR